MGMVWGNRGQGKDGDPRSVIIPIVFKTNLNLECKEFVLKINISFKFVFKINTSLEYKEFILKINTKNFNLYLIQIYIFKYDLTHKLHIKYTRKLDFRCIKD